MTVQADHFYIRYKYRITNSQKARDIYQPGIIFAADNNLDYDFFAELLDRPSLIKPTYSNELQGLVFEHEDVLEIIKLYRELMAVVHQKFQEKGGCHAA